MKIPKKARHGAKQLFLCCQAHGLLDDAKARQMTQIIIQQKPRGYLAILTHFKRLVQLDLQDRTAKVESVMPLDPGQQTAFQANLSRAYGPGLQFEYGIDATLIGGVRVRVGSDVYDGSMRARLNALQESF